VNIVNVENDAARYGAHSGGGVGPGQRMGHQSRAFWDYRQMRTARRVFLPGITLQFDRNAKFHGP